MAEFPRSPEGDPDYLAAISRVDPFLIAAMRQRQGVQPEGGRQVGVTPIENAIPASAADPFGVPSWLAGQVSPEFRDAWRGQYEGNKLGSVLGAFATPGAVLTAPVRTAGAIAKAAPKTTGATLGAILGLSSDEAETGPLSDRDIRRQRESARIAKQRLETESRAAKDAVELERIKAENERRAKQEAFEQQQRIEAETQAAQAAEAKRKAEMPLRERFPELAAGLPLATPIAGLASGYVAGRWGRGGGPVSKVATIGGAGLAGAGEGAVMNILPTEYDAATLPLGSPNQVKAGADFADPNFWLTRIGPAAAMGGASAMIGAKYGLGPSASRATAPQVSAPSTSPKDYTSPLVPYLDDAGRWRDPKGRFARPLED